VLPKRANHSRKCKSRDLCLRIRLAGHDVMWQDVIEGVGVEGASAGGGGGSEGINGEGM